MASLVTILDRPAIRAGAVLLLTVMIGVCFGVMVDRVVFGRPLRMMLAERASPIGVPEMVEKLDRIIDLDSAQAIRVTAVLEHRQPIIREEWIRARTALLCQLDTTLAELATVLTPEQQARLVGRLKARGIPTAGSAEAEPATSRR